MKDKQKARIIELKRREVEEELRQWALRKNVIGLGEHLTFELHILRIDLVAGCVNVEGEEKILLPLDEPIERGTQTIWRLTAEDWEKIERVSWITQELIVIKLLRAKNNGPLSKGELIAHGVVWPTSGHFISRFNTKLKSISDYFTSEEGAYYRLERLGGMGKYYYAIRKTQHCKAHLKN